MELAVKLGHQIVIGFPKEVLCGVVLRTFSSGIPILVCRKGRAKLDYKEQGTRREEPMKECGR